MNVQRLPDVIINMIFLYLQSPEAKLIKNELKIYETDHNYYHTKSAGLYYIRNILSFSCYYFDKFQDPFEYESSQSKYLGYEYE
jgi:hypothetical protein